MTLDDSILGMRLRVMHRAQALGNASAACREAGLSRTRFYGWRQRFERYGPDGLRPRRRQARPGRPPQTPPPRGTAGGRGQPGVADVGLRPAGRPPAAAGPGAGGPQHRAADPRGAGLPTRRQRLGVLEAYSARPGGLLTDRSRRQLQRARPGPPRHVEATTPGELVCLDTFYLGKLKGVGKVWQLTACDAACSYGVARLLPALSAEAAAGFLRQVLVPLYRRAGWPLRRLLTDRGAEFKGAFDAACRALGIRHTRAQPRHAWTNGFVERLQGTILQEHWRIQFRRRYFTSRAGLQQTLEVFLRFYNTQRPHQGYRLRD